MTNPLVSIIIPVYNGEKWLSNAINSAIEQSYKNIEIIIIDDGSSDKSLSICKYFCFDKRVKVFTKKNGGQSSARNLGLLHSQGDYVMFLDCDDTLVNNACEVSVSALKSYTDFVLYGFNVYNKGILLRTPHPKTLSYNGEYDKFMSFSWLLASPCNKLYKREYITSNFLERCVYGEDGIFNYENLQSKTRIECIDSCLYNVNLDNPFSVNKRYREGRMRDTIYSLYVMMTKIESMFSKNNDIKKYWSESLSTLAYTIILCASKKTYKDFNQELNSYLYKSRGSFLMEKYPSVSRLLKAHNKAILYMLRHNQTFNAYMLSLFISKLHAYKAILHRFIH